jgi:hypothetical protein
MCTRTVVRVCIVYAYTCTQVNEICDTITWEKRIPIIHHYGEEVKCKKKWKEKHKVKSI